MKKRLIKNILLSTTALSLFAIGTVYATTNENNTTNNSASNSTMMSSSSNTEMDMNVDQSNKKVESDGKNVMESENVDTSKEETEVEDITGDLKNYYNNGESVDISNSKNLTEKGKDTYRENMGHRQGVDGARTDGSGAYENDKNFENNKMKTPDMKQSSKDAKKMESKITSKNSQNTMKTLPKTSAIE